MNRLTIYVWMGVFFARHIFGSKSRKGDLERLPVDRRHDRLADPVRGKDGKPSGKNLANVSTVIETRLPARTD